MRTRAAGPRSAAGTDAAGVVPDVPLVSSPISEHSGFEVFPVSVKIVRPFTGKAPTAPDRSGTLLQGFSRKSKSRLRFLAANCADQLISQFCMTYGDVWPLNGRSLKADLHKFLVYLKRSFPHSEYLWIAEFQTRGCPHFHLFTNIEVNQVNHQELTRIWHQVAGYGQDKHLRVHGHKSNFIPWKMLTGSYLCKYLDKEHQKAIPQGFQSFGRWWGNARTLKPSSTWISLEEIEQQLAQDICNTETGEVQEEINPTRYLLRTLGRYHERKNRRSWFRKVHDRSQTLLTGAQVFHQTLEYLHKLKGVKYANETFDCW
jgi:hypothetical protein